jgi:hypothetical protein
MLQSLLMPGELVSFSIPWLLGVREIFGCESGAISHPASKIHPGMSQLHVAMSSVVMFQAHSSMTLHGTEYLHLFSVRRPSRCLSLACSRALE